MDLHLPGSDYAQPHSALAGRRVLVTGGRGTLGQALCQGFASLGCEVWSVDQSPMRAGEHPAGLHQRVADVRDRASLEAVQADIARGAKPKVQALKKADSAVAPEAPSGASEPAEGGGGGALQTRNA